MLQGEGCEKLVLSGDDSGLFLQNVYWGWVAWAEDNGGGWTPRFRRHDLGKRPTGKAA